MVPDDQSDSHSSRISSSPKSSSSDDLFKDFRAAENEDESSEDDNKNDHENAKEKYSIDKEYTSKQDITD